MTLQTDNGPTNAPSDLSTAWTTGLYSTTRVSSRFRVRVNQGGAPAWNHVYGFGKTGTTSARGPQPYTSAVWEVNDNVEWSWTAFGADQVTEVEVVLSTNGTTQTDITSYTISPKHLNVPAQLVSGRLVIQVPVDTRLYVEVNGNSKDALGIFSDPIGANTSPSGATTYTVNSAGTLAGLTAAMGANHPANTTPGSYLVVVFEPGIWSLPTSAGTNAAANGATAINRELASMLMPVKPFTKIHIKRGAWVIGSWDIRNSNDLLFSGPGTLSGEWATWANMNNVLHGTSNSYGRAMTFNEQIAWAMFCGTTYQSDDDFVYPNMTAERTSVVGNPYYTFARGIGGIVGLKVVSHWRGNCDGATGLALEQNLQVTNVDKCFFMVGDDGLNRDNNFGYTLVTNSHCICLGGAPINLGYWPEAYTSATSGALFQNLTVQSYADPDAWYGKDLYSGTDLWTWGVESTWTEIGPYAHPHSFTESIIKLWMDGADDEPNSYGRFNIIIKDVHVEGVVPRALFSIENCFYPFGTMDDKAGNAANIVVQNVSTEAVPQYRSRLIGRDRSNTPHDITFQNITIAGELLTTWNWNDHVVQDSSPYNIFVEGRLVTTAVDVCNTALAHLGETANVLSVFPPDGSAQAALCNRFYNVAVEELLTLHPWSFATKRADLTEDATNDLDQSWGFSYQVPGDVGRVLQVIPPDTPDNVVDATTREQPSHTLEQDAAGDLRLYSNIEDAVLRYTTYVYDANKYPALFVSALSWLLASKLAGPLIKGDVGAAEAKRCLQMVQWYIGKAVAVDGLQRNQKPTHSVPWIAQR